VAERTERRSPGLARPDLNRLTSKSPSMLCEGMPPAETVCVAATARPRTLRADTEDAVAVTVSDIGCLISSTSGDLNHVSGRKSAIISQRRGNDKKVRTPGSARMLMSFTDYARRVAAMVVLWIPDGYNLATSQWRYTFMYRMRRPHEGDFRALALLNFSSPPLLIDVGGNVGQSVLSLYTIFPNAKILSFEPNPAVFRKLQRLTKRFPQLTAIPNGLSDETGEAELFIPSYNGSALSGLASFDYESAKGWLSGERIAGFDPNKLTVASERVSLARLDDLGLAPDFIKIDVQGLEPRVIAGGLETIRKCRPVIMAETTQYESDAHRILQPLDYRLMEFDGRGFTEVRGELRRLNQFLIPAERLPHD
jgi:FkbM family methyltransferase